MGARANVAGAMMGPGSTANMMALTQMAQKAASFCHLGQSCRMTRQLEPQTCASGSRQLFDDSQEGHLGHPQMAGE